MIDHIILRQKPNKIQHRLQCNNIYKKNRSDRSVLIVNIEVLVDDPNGQSPHNFQVDYFSFLVVVNYSLLICFCFYSSLLLSLLVVVYCCNFKARFVVIFEFFIVVVVDCCFCCYFVVVAAACC